MGRYPLYFLSPYELFTCNFHSALEPTSHQTWHLNHQHFAWLNRNSTFLITLQVKLATVKKPRLKCIYLWQLRQVRGLSSKPKSRFTNEILVTDSGAELPKHFGFFIRTTFSSFPITPNGIVCSVRKYGLSTFTLVISLGYIWVSWAYDSFHWRRCIYYNEKVVRLKGNFALNIIWGHCDVW